LSNRCAQLSPKHDSTARHVVATTTREATRRAAVHRSTHAPATGQASPPPLHETGPAWRSRISRADRREQSMRARWPRSGSAQRRTESVEIDDAPRAPRASSHGRVLWTRARSSPGTNHLEGLGSWPGHQFMYEPSADSSCKHQPTTRSTKLERTSAPPFSSFNAAQRTSGWQPDRNDGPELQSCECQRSGEHLWVSRARLAQSASLRQRRVGRASRRR